jgi:hypothetical protein
MVGADTVPPSIQAARLSASRRVISLLIFNPSATVVAKLGGVQDGVKQPAG